MNRFSDEYDYLLHLLSCAVHDTIPEEKPDMLSFERVLECGIEHEVANFAFLAVQKLKDPPDAKLMNRWEQVYWQAVNRDHLQSKARAEILHALHANGIDTLEVQGTVVKDFYPERHLRMMSDLDFIVPEEQLGKLVGIMQELGYEASVFENTEVDAHKGSAHVELHTEFFEEENVTRPALNHPFSYAELHDDHTATVSDTVFYLFHLLHTIKHCTQKGSGFRRILDLYYLEDALQGKVDSEYIDKVLKQHGFYELKEMLLDVMKHWFHGIEPKIDISEFEADIKTAGNHGTKELYYKYKFAREKAEGKRFAKLRYFFTFAFPPKEYLYQKYPFCEKHHYPLLLCWIHRFNCSLFSKDSRKNWKTVFRN